MSRCYNSHYYLVVSSTLCLLLKYQLLLSYAATCVDYDDESVCIIMNGNGKGIH